MKKTKEVIFASWIANIERLYEPGQMQMVENMRTVLQHYLNVDELLGILRKDQGTEKEWKLVDYAMELSLCESERKEKMSMGRNLTSVFSRITADAGPGPAKRYYPVVAEDVQAIFPKERAEDSGLPQLACQFMGELTRLEKNCPDTWEDFIVVFDTIMRKYTWCITASDYEGEDISLYNQSRIAAAIAGCVCACGQEELGNEGKQNYFKLVIGDFAGIQKYVFSVANVSEAGVAKRLRARSFYVDITVSVVAQMLIERFHLTQNHILMLTGGKFYLLLPNSPDSDRILEAAEQEMEREFYAKFKGQIYIKLAWITMGEQGLKNYSMTVTELSRLLAEKKSRAFYHNFVQNGEWQEEEFLLYQDLNGKEICRSCGGELTDKGTHYCENCQTQTKIGGRLPRVKYIAYYREQTEDAYQIYGNYWIGLWEKPKQDKAFLIEAVNSTEIPDSLLGKPISPRFMANHIPTNAAGEVMTFEDIADASRGIHKLAVLKADVDNLGYLFADGLRKKERHYGTISRVNTMSRMLELFFSGYINYLTTKLPEYKNVYSVFSGGDDLFLIGPWEVMPKLALEIEARFHEFAAYNPALTISAAVSIFHPKEHIASQAELSEASLKRVKNKSVPELYPEKEGRNGVCFMKELYSWEDLKRQLEIGEKLARLLTGRKLDSGILKRIGDYSRMYRKFLLDKDVMSLMFAPLFHYDKDRNYEILGKKANSDEEIRWFVNEYAAELDKNVADIRSVKKDLYFAEADTIYAMYITKEERTHGV